jgi:hypothetical protein
MKVLALNGSPRMKASSTYHMLKPLLEGIVTLNGMNGCPHIPPESEQTHEVGFVFRAAAAKRSGKGEQNDS